jgi:phage gp36-like protein
MPYATQADLIARYGEDEIARLSTIVYSAPVAVDAARVATALSDASALMDGYLRKQVSLPIAAPPAELVMVCCKLARHLLASQGEGRAASEAVQREHDAAVKWLRDVAAGLVEIAVPQPAAGATGDGARVSDRARPDFGSFV